MKNATEQIGTFYDLKETYGIWLNTSAPIVHEIVNGSKITIMAIKVYSSLHNNMHDLIYKS